MNDWNCDKFSLWNFPKYYHFLFLKYFPSTRKLSTVLSQRKNTRLLIKTFPQKQDHVEENSRSRIYHGRNSFTIVYPPYPSNFVFVRNHRSHLHIEILFLSPREGDPSEKILLPRERERNDCSCRGVEERGDKTEAV